MIGWILVLGPTVCLTYNPRVLMLANSWQQMEAFDDQLSAMVALVSDQVGVCFQMKAFSPSSSKLYILQRASTRLSFSRHFDVPGILARDLEKLSEFAKGWHGTQELRNKQEVGIRRSSSLPQTSDDSDDINQK